MTQGQGTVTVLVPPKADQRAKGWCKHVTGVDVSQETGHAFDGPWVNLGRRTELPPGAVLLRVEEIGPAKTRMPSAQVFRVGWDGSLTLIEDSFGPVQFTGYDWVGELKERVAVLIAGPIEDGQQVFETRLTVFATPRQDGLRIQAAFDGLVIGSWSSWEEAEPGLMAAIRGKMTG